MRRRRRELRAMLRYVLERRETGADAVTTKEIALRLGMSHMTAYRLVCAAHAMGYIDRRPRRGYGTAIEVVRMPSDVAE